MNKIMIKRRLFSIVLCLAFISAAAGADVRLGFKLYGGWGTLDGGDLNSGSEGIWSALKALLLEAPGVTAAGEFAPVHSGVDVGGDLLLEFSRSFGISLGAGYVRSSRTSLMSFSGDLSPHSRATNNADVRADAVRLSLQARYVLPTTSGLSVVFHAGPDLYLAGIRSRVFLVLDGSEYWIVDSQADGMGLGLQGGVGLEYDLNSHLGFFLEAVGRYADFAGFDGKSTMGLFGTESFTSTGTLYYWDYVSSIQNNAEILCYSASPNNPNYKNVREAKIDFSGISLRLGAVIRLGPGN